MPSPSGDVIVDISAAMARQGFEPEIRSVRDGAEIILQACPFASIALTDRQTICSLHLGIAEGLAGDTAVDVTELIAYDPRKADCRLRIRVRPDPSHDELAGTLSLRGGRDVGDRTSRRERRGAVPRSADRRIHKLTTSFLPSWSGTSPAPS